MGALRVVASLKIEPARLSSLADALNDSGAEARWGTRSIKIGALHVMRTDAWQITALVGGVRRVLAIGGFQQGEERGGAEAWFRATTWTRRALKTALQGVVMVLIRARKTYGKILAYVRQGAARSERLATLLSFIPSQDLSGAFRAWVFQPELEA